MIGMVSMLATACKKVEVADALGDKGQRIIGIRDYGGLGANYSTASLSFDPTSTSEMVEVRLVFSTPVLSSTDITATISVDAAAVTSYNATVTDPLAPHYTLLNTSAYTLATNKVKILANQTESEPFWVEFHPDQIDGSVNLMLPLTITALDGAPAGVAIAAGTKTAYFHFIGNPLSGFYNMTGNRYNYTGAVTWSGPPAAVPGGYTLTTYNYAVFASAIDGQNVHFDMGNVPDPAGGLAQYYLTTNPTYTAITSWWQGATFEAGYSNLQRYTVFYTPPTPTQKPAFRLITKYNNTTGGAGNDRIVDQTFTHQ